MAHDEITGPGDAALHNDGGPLHVAAAATHLAQQAQRLAQEGQRLAEDARLLAEERQRVAQAGQRRAERRQRVAEAAQRLAQEAQLTAEEHLRLARSYQAALDAEVAVRLRDLDRDRARLEAILGSMGDAVLVVDAQGTPALTNPAYQRLFGSDGPLVPEDADGRRLPPEAHPAQRAARGESFTLPGRAGRRWFEAQGQAVHPAGERWGVVVIRDITARSLRRLQEEFLTLASHELRTPLTPLHGYLDLLHARLQREGHAPGARYAALAQAEVRHLTTLVDDLLEVGRLQTGRLRLEREPVVLQRLAQQAIAALQGAGTPPLILHAPRTALRVEGDPVRLQQVLRHLLHNALVYAPESPQIDVRLHRARGVAVLEVRDAGAGIPAVALPHLFERFYQVAPGAHGSREGLGIGLFLTRELVQAHGGTIAVHVGDGRGTTVTVQLPLAPRRA